MLARRELFDLIVVGGSFAGLVCARTAAIRGLKVAVIEAKDEPGARVHTTGILVKEAADEIDIPGGLTRRVHGVRLYAPNLAHMDLFAPGYYFLTTRTADLLRWLAREAERAGARLMCGTRFSGAHRRNGLVHLDELPLSARYLVGADGARSRVAECFGLGRNNRFLVGVEAEYHEPRNMDPRFLHCFADSRLAPGYLAWVAPGPGLAQVGLATRRQDRPDLAAFTARIGARFGLDRAQIIERRSGLIPTGGLVRPFSGENVLLVGDAAGLVSPMTGGGIQLAFRFGRRAAQAASDHLLDGGPDPGRVMAREYPRFHTKYALRRLMNLAPYNFVLNSLLLTPPARALAQYIYFHRRGRGDMSYPEYLRAIRAVPEGGEEGL
ncbi:MAG: NAD(P)/FAD-dependent oxidoreductase [Alphaproteobacteria bacterium]